MKKILLKGLISTFGILIMLVNVFAADGDLNVNGNANIGQDLTVQGDIKGNGTNWFNFVNQGSGEFNFVNTSGGVRLRLTNNTLNSPLILEYKADQDTGGHVDVIPGGAFDYWLFNDAGKNPSFKICGKPTGASGNECVNLKIDGVYNDLNMTTEGTNSDIILMPGQNVGIGTDSPTEKLYVIGNIYATGIVSWGSSRELKEDIRDLKSEEAITALNNLNPKKYFYKADNTDEHIGFIAEDVPDLIATKDRKSLDPMDIVAVLTSVVKEQQKTIADLSKKVTELERDMKLKESLAMTESNIH